jgi:thioesterase domain-containing protein
VRDIRALQPTGPYSIAGVCYGGIFALEAALQLQAQGEKVDLLMIWQTRVPEFYRDTPLRALGYAARKILLHLRSGTLLNGIREKLLTLRKAGKIQFGLQMYTLGATQPVPELAHRHYDIWGAIWRAISGYRVTAPYQGRITCVCCAEQTPYFPHVIAGWDGLCSELVVLSLPGDHLTHMSSLTPECGEAIRAALARTDKSLVGEASK